MILSYDDKNNCNNNEMKMIITLIIDERLYHYNIYLQCYKLHVLHILTSMKYVN